MACRYAKKKMHFTLSTTKSKELLGKIEGTPMKRSSNMYGVSNSIFYNLKNSSATEIIISFVQCAFISFVSEIASKTDD